MIFKFFNKNQLILNDSVKFIEFDDSYQFCFLEDKDLKILHPVSNYYLKLDDLSINLFISLKWIKWGHKFFISLKNELDNMNNQQPANYNIDKIISTSIQKFDSIKINEKEKLLIIDNKIVNVGEDFNVFLKNNYDNEKLNLIFNSNTKIHLKLKLNLREYLIITNILYPTFIKFSNI